MERSDHHRIMASGIVLNSFVALFLSFFFSFGRIKCENYPIAFTPQ